MASERDHSPGDGDKEVQNVSGRDKSHESSPTKSGHSTAEHQTRRNQEDESPS